jgi:hypothetical protein
MNSGPKVAFATAVFVFGVSGIDLLPRHGGEIGGLTAISSPPVVSPSPGTSLTGTATRISVAGAELTSRLDLTVELPAAWEPLPFGARLDVSDSDSTMFFVSLVDNTFQDPCSHTQRSPKIGSTVEAKAAALGEIPDTTATAPVQTTVAGHEATYVEVSIPAPLPCAPDEFYLWQDSPDGDWWVTAHPQVVRIWILDVEGQAIAIAARTFPGTTDETKTELLRVLDSIAFDAASTQPSTTPATP